MELQPPHNGNLPFLPEDENSPERKRWALETKISNYELMLIQDISWPSEVNQRLDEFLQSKTFSQIWNTKPFDLRAELLMTNAQLHEILADNMADQHCYSKDEYFFSKEPSNAGSLSGKVASENRDYQQIRSRQRNIDGSVEWPSLEVNVNDRIEWRILDHQLTLIRLKYLFGGAVKNPENFEKILFHELRGLKKSLNDILLDLSSPECEEENFHYWQGSINRLYSYIKGIELENTSRKCAEIFDDVDFLICDIKAKFI